MSEIDGKRKQMQTRLTAIAPKRETGPALDCTTEGEKIAEVLRRMDEVLTA